MLKERIVCSIFEQAFREEGRWEEKGLWDIDGQQPLTFCTAENVLTLR